MSDELVEQLCFLGLDEAADEIERLRNRYEILSSLITAWAVARPRLSDGSRSKTFEDACDALRKAVGR